MTLKEFKVWGGKRKEKDSLYIWAKDADDAIGIARLTDQSICISQWTGNEKSYEEALEQEPCEDAVNRAEVKNKAIRLWNGGGDEDYKFSTLIDYITELPPVTPTRKKGKWIGHGEHCENLGVIPSGLGAYEWCSNCDCGIDVREWHRNHYNYCPNCGAEMESEE